MKLTLFICLALLSAFVLSVPVDVNEKVDDVEYIADSGDVVMQEDELSRKFKGPIKLKKCSKPDQTIEYYQKWCPTAPTTTTTTTTTPATTTTTTTAATTTTTTMAG